MLTFFVIMVAAAVLVLLAVVSMKGDAIILKSHKKLNWLRARLAAIADENSGHSRVIRWSAQAGKLSVETIIYIFVAIIIVYQLIPQISDADAAVQASGNVSTMGKFASGLGEWLFPLFGLLALVFLLWSKRGKGSENGT